MGMKTGRKNINDIIKMGKKMDFGLNGLEMGKNILRDITKWKKSGPLDLVA